MSFTTKSICGEIDEWAYSQGYYYLAGVDEVGRGSLAGPVVAAAVVLAKNHAIKDIADSKKLSANKRKELDKVIRIQAKSYGVGMVNSDIIDATNIRHASLQAMSLAFEQILIQKTQPHIVLVDGRDTFPLPQGQGKMCFCVKSFIHGDSRSQTIAAASIVAKVYRDALLMRYHLRWPMYGFDHNKGYPTVAHKQALRKYGPCKIHRRTFRGVL